MGTQQSGPHLSENQEQNIVDLLSPHFGYKTTK